jgi:hydroxymethylbilane synthase
MREFRLATRASPLALWQARAVAALLRQHHPGLIVRLVTITTGGDLDRETPLHRSETVGVFVREVQAAVLAGRAEAAVHSAKDLPTSEPTGLVIAACLRRADPRDALVGAESLAALPPGALVGTSSLRRQAQLAARRGDLRFASIRGNVETRLMKVEAGEFAATVMAMAGLARLGLLRRARAAPLDPWMECTPAPAQGAIAVECRADDRRAQRLLAALDHRETAIAIGVERAVLAGLAGGCSLPLGCLCRRREGRWRLRVRLGTDDGLRELDLDGCAAGLAERALERLG